MVSNVMWDKFLTLYLAVALWSTVLDSLHTGEITLVILDHWALKDGVWQVEMVETTNIRPLSIMRTLKIRL